MNRYAALLRAINVGGRNVKMDALREVFVQLGFHSAVGGESAFGCLIPCHPGSGRPLYRAAIHRRLCIHLRKCPVNAPTRVHRAT